MTEPKLFGVLVTFRRLAALAAMLGRLAQQEHPLDGLVVVDNEPSTDARRLVDAYAERGHPVEYVGTPENLGPAGGRAEGVDRVLKVADDADWIVCLDDDEPPSVSDLGELLRFGQEMLGRDPTTGAVGVAGTRFDPQRALVVRVRDDELSGPVRVDAIGGGQLPFYRVETIRQAGAFARELFFGFEELELGLRLREHGYSLYADGPRWRERRERAGRLGLDLRPSRVVGPLTWRRYYSLRNVIYILRKHGWVSTAVRVSLLRGLVKPLANLPLSPGEAIRHLGMNSRALRDAWTGRMGRAVEPDEMDEVSDHNDPRPPVGVEETEVRT